MAKKQKSEEKRKEKKNLQQSKTDRCAAVKILRPRIYYQKLIHCPLFPIQKTAKKCVITAAQHEKKLHFCLVNWLSLRKPVKVYE